MGLQLGLVGLGLAVFALILWDALRRRRRAAEEAEEYIDPEEEARREQLERELPSLASSDQTRTRQDLDPLFDHIEVFDDDPIPVLTQKTPSPQQMLAEESQVPAEAEQEIPLNPSLETMRALFSYDPGFAEASQAEAQARQSSELASDSSWEAVDSTRVAEADWPQVDESSQFDTPASAAAEIETDQSDLVDLNIAPPAAASSQPRPQPQAAAPTTMQQITELEKTTWKLAEEFITLNVTAQPGQLFSGALLQKVAQTIGLELSANGFYHYVEPQGTGLGYSLMNMYSPGRFDPSQLDQVATSGLVLVMPLPGPKDAKQVFERMLATAQIFEHNLQAELQDEQRSNLTQQTIEHYRQRIQDFERQRRLKKMKAGRHDAAAP